MTLVSRASGRNGVGGDGDSFTPWISADGRFVSFTSSADNLSPADANGTGNDVFVRDLKKEDFQVLEDGKPQTINAFTFVDIPIERADRPLYSTTPFEPDVRTNERAFEGRVDDGIELERDMFCLLFSTRDAHEGMHAFIDKRQPTFEGN